MKFQPLPHFNCYSKRLRRPRFWDLNPFWGLSDGRFNWEGNPFLEPELTDSYELGFLKEFSLVTYMLEHIIDILLMRLREFLMSTMSDTQFKQ